MDLRYLPSSILLVIILLQTRNDGVSADVVVGADCSGDSNICSKLANSECDVTGRCVCKMGHLGIEGLTWCVRVLIGHSCALNNKDICNQIPNATCDFYTSKCTCQAGLISTDDNSACIQVFVG